jgi:hypothetical protein
MESVYGRKRLAASAEVRETWMGRFTQLEPEGGFRAVAQQAWNRGTPALHRAGSLGSPNWRVQVEPVYGQKYLSASAGVRKTWMDRFTKLEPEGGFRTTAKQAWSMAADRIAPPRRLAA